MENPIRGHAARRLIVADDNQAFASALGLHLQEAGVIDVLAVGTGQDLIRSAEAFRPDAVTLDIQMPWNAQRTGHTSEGAGLDALIALRHRHPELPVVVVSQFSYPTYIERVLAHGLRGLGYVLKENVFEPNLLPEALERVIKGESAVDPLLVDSYFRQKAVVRQTSAFTDFEQQTLQWMAEGLSNRGIARKMFVSVKTVEIHIRHIYDKLNILSEPDANRRVRAVLKWLDDIERASGCQGGDK